jgi:hypothetical protein
VQDVINELSVLSNNIGGKLDKAILLSGLSSIDGINSVSDNGTRYPEIGFNQYPLFNIEGVIYESNKSST